MGLKDSAFHMPKPRKKGRTMKENLCFKLKSYKQKSILSKGVTKMTLVSSIPFTLFFVCPYQIPNCNGNNQCCSCSKRKSFINSF